VILWGVYFIQIIFTNRRLC